MSKRRILPTISWLLGFMVAVYVAMGVVTLKEKSEELTTKNKILNEYREQLEEDVWMLRGNVKEQQSNIEALNAEVELQKDTNSQLQTENTKLQEELRKSKAETEKAKAETKKAKSEATASSTMPSRGTEAKKTMYMKSTAYIALCDTGCTGITATGIDLRKNPGVKVIAVDPNIIPLGTKVHVEGYGYAVAGDTGGAIKGGKIDVYLPTVQEAKNWGVRTVKVTILK